jgi:hypothetical protein
MLSGIGLRLQAAAATADKGCLLLLWHLPRLCAALLVPTA